MPLARFAGDIQVDGESDLRIKNYTTATGIRGIGGLEYQTGGVSGFYSYNNTKPYQMFGNMINLQERGLSSTTAGDENKAIFDSAISDAPSGGVIYVPPGETYPITGIVTVNKSLGIVATGATLHWSTDAVSQGLDITASNVSLLGGTYLGPQYASQVATQQGINIYGTVGSYLSNIQILGCNINTWGQYGVVFTFVEDFLIRGNTIKKCVVAGCIGLSCQYGIIQSNVIDTIHLSAGGSVGDSNYGISVSKSNGDQATFPISHDVVIDSNVIRDVRQWKGIDTHGGYRVTATSNHIYDCRIGVGFVSYTGSAGDEVGPRECIVANNTCVVNHGAGELIDANDTQRGVVVAGNFATTAQAENNIVSNNVVLGYGDEDGSNYAIGSIELQYSKDSICTGNLIDAENGESGVHGIMIFSCEEVLVSDNVIKGLSGTAGVAASSTFTFTGLPIANETITLYGTVFTFKASSSNSLEITIGGSAEATIDNAVTIINAYTGGNVSIATASKVSTDQLVITFDEIGRVGNTWYTTAESATNVTVSGTELGQGTGVSGTEGASGIAIRTLSGGGPASTGLIQNNIIHTAVAQTGILSPDTITGLNFINNRLIDETAVAPFSTLYDLQDSAAGYPNSGAGDIPDMLHLKATVDLGSIATGASATFNIGAIGLSLESTNCVFFAGCSRDLQGLVVYSENNHNYIQVTINNTTGGAIDMDSTTFHFICHRKFGTPDTITDVTIA